MNKNSFFNYKFTLIEQILNETKNNKYNTDKMQLFQGKHNFQTFSLLLIYSKVKFRKLRIIINKIYIV